MSVTISARAADTSPTLSAWISSTGLACQVVPVTGPERRRAARLLHVSELEHATASDILIEFRDGPPEYVWPANGRPARIGFGFADMAFGHAMLTELVRPPHRPASGEPESGRFLQMCARVAASDATILVLGETGTGKEGIARLLHDTSPRADKDFIAVNCAALPESMMEAMLFGHKKGSFTGAGTSSDGLFLAANGGTLFLDEIAELPLALQAKLLRALQEGEVLPVGATHPVAVNVRVVAACNRDLAGEAEAGRFRADLYWRLNVMPLHLNALAERRGDIIAITAAFLLRHQLQSGTASTSSVFAWPTPAALERLAAHRWPGNARELGNVLQRAIVLREGEQIEVTDLNIAGAPPAPTPVAIAAPIAPPRLQDVARASAMDAIRSALLDTGGHRARAATILGISERTLRYRLAEMRDLAMAG